MRLEFETAVERLNKTSLNGTDSWYARSDKASYLVMRDQTGRWRNCYYASYRSNDTHKTTMIKGPGPDGSFPNSPAACLALQQVEDGN